jgi:hypothetical protein
MKKGDVKSQLKPQTRNKYAKAININGWKLTQDNSCARPFFVWTNMELALHDRYMRIP